MAITDSVFKVTVTALGVCTLVVGLSFCATVAGGLTYHMTHSTTPVDAFFLCLDLIHGLHFRVENKEKRVRDRVASVKLGSVG